MSRAFWPTATLSMSRSSTSARTRSRLTSPTVTTGVSKDTDTISPARGACADHAVEGERMTPFSARARASSSLARAWPTSARPA